MLKKVCYWVSRKFIVRGTFLNSVHAKHLGILFELKLSVSLQSDMTAKKAYAIFKMN